MGQTDSQFKAFLRLLLAALKEARSTGDEAKLDQIIENLQKSLED